VWEGLSVLPAAAESVIRDIVISLRDQWEADDRSFPEPRGTLQIESTIPIGAGFGSSAALCVALARWFQDPLGIADSALFEFATRLEHRFHGQSSGMDIAVILAGEPISFVMGKGAGGARSLGVRKLPRFTFHDTGLRSRTSDCVAAVREMHERSPAFAMGIDEAMSGASRLAMEGLIRYDGGDRVAALEILARAIRAAHECFVDWRQVPAEAERLRESLLSQGALAAKLTGAGGGGMMVALWPDRQSSSS
jgi:mevalonate kinase